MASRRRTPRNAPQRRSKARRRAGLPGLALIGLACVLLAFGVVLTLLLLPGPERDRPTSLFVARDTPVSVLSAQLADEGVLRQPGLFSLYLRISGQGSRVIPGSHFLKPGLSPYAVARCLTRSERRPRVTLTIPEGFDQFRVAKRLQALGVCSSADFLAASSSATVLAELAIDGPSAEGYLFPLTYSLPIDSDPRDVLRLWVAETRRRLDSLSRDHRDATQQLREQRGWGEREILTLASIIEKESHHDDERRTVASVFFNRLDNTDFRPRRMLQSDPTAFYGCLASANRYPGCAANPGRVSPAMLRDSQNPYNTYRHAGLPPGPIANPGAGSIAAVLNPDKTEYLFFVAKNGRHVFTKSLAEHEATTHRAE